MVDILQITSGQSTPASEEEQAVRELKLVEEQVVIEEHVVEEVVVETCAAQQVIASEGIMHGTSVNLEEVALQVILVKILFNLGAFLAVLEFVNRSIMCP